MRMWVCLLPRLCLCLCLLCLCVFVPDSVCLFLLSVQRPPLNIYYFITLVELIHYNFGVCISTSPQIWKVVTASGHHYN